MNVTNPITHANKAALVANPDWWRGAVIYQIYPRSYQDSNGDGIGDLRGITERLPHIASLGVDAIWISPFFTSPMLDFGYDVSDYCDIDPIFGTLADFDEMIERAHELGLRIMIDLVLSHTSDQHDWFKESRSSRDNPKSDWYVWADPNPDGTPPNNWLSIFGGPAWEWDAQRMQYYMHNFLREQPDLNFHCPDVQDALLDVTRFWLDRGVDGFRLDTVNFYVHDQELRNNPPVTAHESTIAPQVNPYTWQEHEFSKSRPENVAFIEKFRAVMDEYQDIAAVGEVGDDQKGIQIQAEYTAGTNRLQMCYGFEFLSQPFPTGERISKVMTDFMEGAAESWACWAFSNHDVIRHTSRWDLSPEAQQLYLAVILSLRGSVCLYQGEELGLGEADVAFEDLQDPYGIRFWPKFKGRDGARTPMPWESNSTNAGFSNAKPWLPVSQDHVAKSVNGQASEPSSMLAFYRQMISYRQKQPALVKGTFDIISASETHIAVTREHEGQKMLVVFNLSDEAQAIELPDGTWTVDTSAPFTAEIAGNSAKLGPWQALFAAG